MARAGQPLGSSLTLRAQASFRSEGSVSTVPNTPVARRDWANVAVLALRQCAAVSQLRPVEQASLARRSRPGPDRLQPGLAEPLCPGAPCPPAALAA